MSASSQQRKRAVRPEEESAADAREGDPANRWRRAAARHKASDSHSDSQKGRASRTREAKRARAHSADDSRALKERFLRAGGDDGRARLSNEWSEERAAQKPLRFIVENLERAYGVPVNRRLPRAVDPLDMLVQIILSQATSDVNSERTYAALKRRFPAWDSVLRAREATLADTIRAGGLANQKAKVIREVLRQIKERTGGLTLDFLHDAPLEEAVRFLSGFRGIGPKTVACTLLFACHKDVFPLDTHIFRILRRIGLIPQKCTDARAHELMNKLAPPGKFYSFHVNLIRHGRAICRPRDPLCGRCPVIEYCDYGQQIM